MYLVTGATGQLGKRVVQRLCEQNRPVRAFVRLMSRYSELEAWGAEIFIGDLQDSRDIAKACRGVRYIISTHGSSETSGGGTAQAIDYRANVELIEQAKLAKVKHFTFISVLGVERGYEDSPIFKAKGEVERYLQSSGLKFTILRPGSFASNVLNAASRFRQSGVYILIGNPENRTSLVSPDDLAAIATVAAQSPAAQDQIFAVGAEPIQRGDIPKILGKLLEREPRVINFPLLAVDSARGAIGLFNPQLKEDLGTFRLLMAEELFCSPEEIERVEQVFALKLENLEQFLRRYLLQPPQEG